MNILSNSIDEFAYPNEQTVKAKAAAAAATVVRAMESE